MDNSIIAGDGKTYEHLMDNKHQYSAELEKKLIIFPGDWHIATEEFSMKIHYNAGLKELAMASGFRVETLTSLSKCSNFKRTHDFIPSMAINV